MYVYTCITIHMHRDPFDSIWSEFQRIVSKSHVGSISSISFDEKVWNYNAEMLSTEYLNMLSVQYRDIEKNFNFNDYIYVKYEDLKNEKNNIEVRKIEIVYQFFLHVFYFSDFFCIILVCATIVCGFDMFFCCFFCHFLLACLLRLLSS